MSPIVTSGIVFLFIFGGLLLGALIRLVLSERHLSGDSKDVVKMSVGLIATLSALVLGLLIATAKSSHDTKVTQIQQIAANIAVMDQFLAQYGPETTKARDLLRRGIGPVIDQIWGESGTETAKMTPFKMTSAAEVFYQTLNELSPQNDYQRSLLGRVIQTATELGQTRLRLHEDTGRSIPIPFLVILVFWLAMIFASFGLLTELNGFLLVILFLCALSASGAIFLILDLDVPFHGMMGISSDQLKNLLPPLNS